jgi:hypothetical protein
MVKGLIFLLNLFNAFELMAFMLSEDGAFSADLFQIYDADYL